MNSTGRTIWEVALEPEAVPGLAAAAIKSIGAVHRADRGAARRVRGRPGRRVAAARCSSAPGYLDALRAERTIEAEGRIENLEELVGVAAEFDANREVEGQSDISPLEEFLQAISLYTDQDDLERDESQGDADDPAQREGARVRRRLHHRLRGGGLPALALPRGGKRGGGAPPLLRRDHAGAQATLDDPCSQPADLRRAGRPASRRGSSPSCPTTWWSGREREEQAITGWSLGGQAPGAPTAARPVPVLRHRRRRRPRQLRRWCRHGGRAGRRDRRPLRRATVPSGS